MKAADALERIVIGSGKYQLVQDDVATMLILVGSEWWKVTARRSDKQGR